MDTIHLPKDFREFLRLLNSHKVEYLLIGGFAVGYHGYPRATGDMDIWIATSPENADKMVGVLKEFGFDLPELSADLFLKRRQVIRMGMPPVRIEVLTDISGVSFKECYEKRIADFIDGIKVNLINSEHLRINKKASGRPKDISDLDQLP
ncbi:nucleotidyltransferase [Candidatus Electrothrix sp.]|uniref:nucleotidyltransferase n=1 Tax=Candidatus Electrothrix sp. TaxID=2170559 RepID=UPI004056D863